MTSETTTRRTVLTTGVAAAGAAAGAVALAACGADGGGSSAGSSSSAPLAPPGTVVAPVADVAVGQSTSVTVDGHPAIVARTSETNAVAFSAICTHQGCTVRPSGNQADCPCHGSQYNALTGAVLHGPAELPLQAIPVKIVNGQILTA